MFGSKQKVFQAKINKENYNEDTNFTAQTLLVYLDIIRTLLRVAVDPPILI